jgi:transcriptional regulator with XRE-family HTH domain
MPARERPVDRGRRAVRRAVAELAGDFRATRLALGLSQQSVANAAGMSRSYVGRLERNEVARPGLDHLASLAAALGLRLRLAAYPDGEPIRDRVQLRLVDAFRRRLHGSVGWRTEVPLPIAGDRRAWDAVAIADDDWTAIEAISRLGAVDATLRSANQKQRDDPRIARVVLLVADTPRNRDALRLAHATVRADYPLDTRGVLGALAAGRSPARSGIVLMRIPNGKPAPGDALRPQVVHTGGKRVDAAEPVRPRLVENPVGRAAPGP